LGALLLGVHDPQGRLLYAGKVGTGFTDAALQRLRSQLDAHVQKVCPFFRVPPDARGAHWLAPTLVAEVAFAEWTQDGHVRHAVFKGLRTDKPAKAIVRERAEPPPAGTGHKPGRPDATAAELPPGLHLTHGERVIDRASGSTKLDLARYYATVGPLMLEHLRGRPVALVRAPDGVGKETFFQKHGDADRLPGIAALDPRLDPGHGPLLEIHSAEGLLSAAQMNVIEFHTWNARADRIERPDRITFDLDPGEGVPWVQVQEGAELVRVLLRELGLPAFLKTSGGKGLHVVVPIKRLRDWDSSKAFSQAVVQHLARTIPQRFVAKSGPKNRVGKIFVDYLRNGRGATTVAAWSARARPGLGVSVPVAWSELPTIASGAHWTVTNIEERLRVGNAPWRGYAKAAVALGAAERALGASARG
jgi:bifunctional non-homologous end joining protein LigD